MSRSRRSRPGDRGQRDQREMVWRRIDLHIHTPASADYQDPDISYLDILRKAEVRGADLIAFTDHNSVRGYANMWREIEDFELLEALERLTPAEQRRLDEYRRLLQKIRVLPGFELTTTFGFHVLAIFAEGTSIRQLEHLLLELNVPEDKIDLGSGEVGATVDVLTAYETLHEAGAMVIPAHVNSTHGVAMQNLPFGGQTKIAFTQSPYIAALEATDLDTTSRRSTARFFNGSKPEYPRRMHIIQGSDAHRLNRDPNRATNLGVGDRMTEVSVPEVSWAALRDLFASNDFNRIRPYRPSHDPYDFIRSARSEGETIVQTFHPTPPARRGRLSPILRDAVAFANGNGGTIFVGLSASPKEPVLGVERAAEQARVIAEDIARHTSPPLAGSLDVHVTDGKQVIVISIPSGAEKPYAVLPSTIYVRQEGETTLALRDEIVELVRAGLAQGADLPELVPSTAAAAPQPAPTPIQPERRRREAVRPAQAPTAHQPIPIPAPSTLPASIVPISERTALTARTDAEPQPARARQRPARAQRQAEDVAIAEVIAASAAPSPISPTSPTSPTEIDTPESTTRPAPDIPAIEDIPYPRTGVEIVESVERGGVRYHAMRDLRNLKVVHNVTRDSARRLWRYAITQDEAHDVGPEDVTWQGDRGFWKSYKPRGGDIRYNLVYRHNGHLHVFYGVTDEGMDEAWRAVVPERLLSRQPAEPTLDVPVTAMEDAPEPVEVGGVDAEVVSEVPRFAPLVSAAPAPVVVPTPMPVEPPAADPEPAPEPAAETPPDPAQKPARPRRTRASTATRRAAVAEEVAAVEPPAPVALEPAAAEPVAAADEAAPVPARRTRTRRVAAAPAVDVASEAVAAAAPVEEPAAAPPARRTRTRRAAAPPESAPAGVEPAPAPPKRTRQRKPKVEQSEE